MPKLNAAVIALSGEEARPNYDHMEVRSFTVACKPCKRVWTYKSRIHPKPLGVACVHCGKPCNVTDSEGVVFA